MKKSLHPIFRSSVGISLDGRSNFTKIPISLIFHLQSFDYRIRTEKINAVKYQLGTQSTEERIELLLNRKPYLNYLLYDYVE